MADLCERIKATEDRAKNIAARFAYRICPADWMLLKREARETVDRIKWLEHDLAASESHNNALRKALKPFSDYGRALNDQYVDDDLVVQGMDAARDLLVKDFRRARDVLEGK